MRTIFVQILFSVCSVSLLFIKSFCGNLGVQPDRVSVESCSRILGGTQNFCAKPSAAVWFHDRDSADNIVTGSIPREKAADSDRSFPVEENNMSGQMICLVEFLSELYTKMFLENYIYHIRIKRKNEVSREKLRKTIRSCKTGIFGV